MRVLTVIGTRPEGIKMAPVVAALRSEAGMNSKVCVTAQHRDMLDKVMSFFEIIPDFDLDLMRPGQDLASITSQVLEGVKRVIAAFGPDMVLVHGDTATTLGATLASYYARVPVGHVEAGLRTGNIYAPWPEEVNRKVAAIVAELHFAPTRGAGENLRAEGIPGDHIHVTGNTVIDALHQALARLQASDYQLPAVCAQFSGSTERRLILVTGHRRESFGGGFERVCEALVRLAKRPDVEIVYPVHLNPKVNAAVSRKLSGLKNVHLTAPLDYLPFVYLMSRASVILTDSGGVQEEGPALGKPVLVMRETTERPEAVRAGTVRLVGTEVERIVDETERLLDDADAYRQMSIAHNPYGDGKATGRILSVLRRWHEERLKDR